MLKRAAALALCATPALAEGWQIMYLADSGGSRPMQVGPNEGGLPFPYVDNDRGERLMIDCRNGDDGTYDWTLQFFPGREPTVLPKAAKDNRFIIAFDTDVAEYDLGPFTYVQEYFWADVPDSLASEVMARGVIRLELPAAYTMTDQPYRTEFALTGSAAAIDRSCPTP